MFFKVSKIICYALISWNMLYSVACLKVNTHMYKIVQSHPGLKSCAADQSGKYDTVAVNVSNKTETCEGLPRNSTRKISAYEGYAEMIESVLKLQPSYVFEAVSTYMWSIPGGIDVTSGMGTSILDIFIIGSDTGTLYQFSLNLSEEPLAFAAVIEGFYGYPEHNSSKRISVLHSFEMNHCFMSGYESVHEVNTKSTNKSLWVYGKITFILQEESFKVLDRDTETCLFNNADRIAYFGTFRYPSDQFYSKCISRQNSITQKRQLMCKTRHIMLSSDFTR